MAEDWLFRMTAVHNQLQATLKGVNDRRSELSQKMEGKEARRYTLGDQVLVDWRNLTIPEGIRALSDRWIGPYKVIEDRWNGYAYKLDIPIRTRIRRVIHVSLLKLYRDAPFREAPIRSTPLKDPVLGQSDTMIIDPSEDILFHIEKFVDLKWFGSPRERMVKYRVRWEGYKPAEDTWQSKEETKWPGSV